MIRNRNKNVWVTLESESEYLASVIRYSIESMDLLGIPAIGIKIGIGFKRVHVQIYYIMLMYINLGFWTILKIYIYIYTFIDKQHHSFECFP